MPILGLSEFQAALSKVIAQADAAARSTVAELGSATEKGAKNNFQGSHKKGQPHVGGKHPNVVSGALRRSIRSDAIRKTGIGEYSQSVAPHMVYSRRIELEYGYTYFMPAVRAEQARAAAVAAAQWRKFIHA